MYVTLVLHSHLPWLGRNGTHPVGEQWLFQAWSESYLPLALAQSSDWTFMVTQGDTARYGRERLLGHLERFDAACRGGGLDDLVARDGPLPVPPP